MTEIGSVLSRKRNFVICRYILLFSNVTGLHGVGILCKYTYVCKYICICL